MAESRRAKLARWARGDFTEGEYQGIIAGFVFDQVVDVATGGKLSALKKKSRTKNTMASRQRRHYGRC